jgi:hypothetical protein
VKKPITIEEAEERHLLTDDKKKAVHTFSNGSEADCWLSNNCYECWFYPPEGPAGDLCAFEAAAFIGMVTPELARMFGWIQDMKYDKPDDHRFSWDPPEQCPFFQQRPDKGDDGDTPPPPPDPDPDQIVLIVDPTEDLALAKALEQNVSSPDELLPV